MDFVYDYYREHGEMPDPIYSYIALGVLVVLLVAVAIFNHMQDKKKRGKF